MENPSTQKTLAFTCATCRWWVPGKTLSNMQAMPGQCRRNPPVPVAGGNRWPATDAHEWCGEQSKLREMTRVEIEAPTPSPTDALAKLEQHLTDTAGAAPAGQLGEESGAAVLKTGGAELDAERDRVMREKLAAAEAEPPHKVNRDSFVRPARRR